MLNNDSIYINSCKSYLPALSYMVNDAIANGLYETDEAKNTGYKSVLVEQNLFPAEMALDAVERAVESTNVNNIKHIIYSSIHRSGHKSFWSPASFIQNKLQALNAIPFNLNQGCNGQMIALNLSCSLLNSSVGDDSSLLVSSDCFSHSLFDRWKSDYGLIYGDAATAITLSKKKGFAKIRKLESVSAPVLEKMHRLEDGSCETDKFLKQQYNVRDSKKQFFTKYGLTILTSETHKALKKLYQSIFSENIVLSDIKYFIFPNLGKKILEENYYPVFKCKDNKTLWNFGSTVGHLGTSDCFAGLCFLEDNNKLKTGDYILMIGAGAGFSWTACLLEIC